MKRIISIIYVLLAASLASCGEDAVQPEPPAVVDPAFDLKVRENCELVAAAADSFRARHGRYPWHDGEVVPFLPGGERLVNPATGVTTEPVSPLDPDVLLDPPLLGSVGLRIFRKYDEQWRMVDAGYFVVGRGRDCDVILSNVPADEYRRGRDERVILNSKLVASAAYAFAQDNDGEFALDNAQINESGKRLQDYLPDGVLLENSYTDVTTEPIWGGAAVNPGSVGYVARDANGDGAADGFDISGVGSLSGVTLIAIVFPPEDGVVPPPEVALAPCDSGFTRPPLVGFDATVSQNCDSVAVAAEAYFDANGEYAINRIGLIPYLPGGWWLTNPATHLQSEPSGRFPKHAGEVGYRLMGEYGVGVLGYYVEGFGQNRTFVRTNIPDIERHLALEQDVAAKCHVIEAAADSFAADNGGVYPDGQYDVSRKGRYFQEYLPGGELIVNTYTGERTEPQWNVQVSLPGQITYSGFDVGDDGLTERYGISGIGAMEWGSVYSATWWSRPQPETRTNEEMLRDNMNIIAGAARVYHVTHGQYAGNVATLQPYLPSGDLLPNPLTARLSEPSGSIPDLPGSIGYRLIWEYLSHPVGYYIQGRLSVEYFDATNVPDIQRHLALEAQVVLDCITVSGAAEAFAADNSGVFPEDDTTVNLVGKTVLEYLPPGASLLNPYTNGPAIPVWSVSATSAGQTGYLPWHEDADGVPDGYTVNGIGAASGVSIFVILDPERRWQPPANPAPIRVSGPH